LKFLDHRVHSLGSGNWHCPEFRCHASRIDANLGLNLVSASVQALDWLAVKALPGRGNALY
jgi:hypothetical protein